MRRRLRLQIRAGKTVYDEVCAKAGEAFNERRFRDALAIYEQFAEEKPDVHPEEIQFRIRALKEYIEEHVQKLQRGSPSPSSTERFD